jgi:acyl phosphate:glycerol-3-phosphate acyltransferase
MAIAYLFGSTPTGYLAGKLLKGIDIREHGSKSTGATPRDRPHIRVTSCRR